MTTKFCSIRTSKYKKFFQNWRIWFFFFKKEYDWWKRHVKMLVRHYFVCAGTFWLLSLKYEGRGIFIYDGTFWLLSLKWEGGELFYLRVLLTFIVKVKGGYMLVLLTSIVQVSMIVNPPDLLTCTRPQETSILQTRLATNLVTFQLKLRNVSCLS